jgi:hypothetical protein
MRKLAPVNLVLILLILTLCATPAIAQEGKTQASPEARTTPPGDIHYYRLEFVLKELDGDGRVINSRTYHTAVSTDGRNSSVRTGTKIPVRTSEKAGEMNYVINYIDIGVNIDCGNAHETPQGLALQISAEISSLANPSGAGEASMPIVRQNRWSSMNLIPIGKPTVVFASDNLENKGRMQVEVTATPLR